MTEDTSFSPCIFKGFKSQAEEVGKKATGGVGSVQDDDGERTLLCSEALGGLERVFPRGREAGRGFGLLGFKRPPEDHQRCTNTGLEGASGSSVLKEQPRGRGSPLFPPHHI